MPTDQKVYKLGGTPHIAVSLLLIVLKHKRGNRIKFDKMSSKVKNIFFSAILIVLNNNNLSLAQINCAKIDFNRTAFPEFRDCQGKNLPNFMIKTYSIQTELTPFRLNSKYYLTNNFHDSYSCAESAIQLTLNPTSIIEAAIYLRSPDSSFLEIAVYDVERNERIDSFRTDGTIGWQILYTNIRRTILNARVSSIFTMMSIQV